MHEQLIHLVPGGWPSTLSIARTSELLRRLRPTDPVAVQRREILKDLLTELRVLDRKRKAINKQLDTALDAYGATLTEIVGIGRVGAATVLATVGDVRRFPQHGGLATYNGTAPIAASSGATARWCHPPIRPSRSAKYRMASTV